MTSATAREVRATGIQWNFAPCVAVARDTPARKLGRGFANLSLGVMAIPGHMADTTRESGPFMGATWGLAKGVTMMAVTEVVGVWEIVTAPFAVPPDFVPILDPEFPWQHFTGDPRSREKKRTPTRTR